MTIAKFFGFFPMLWVLLAGLLYVFLRVFNLDSTFMQWLYWFFVFFISLTVIRRIGVLNYLEAFVVAAVWGGVMLLFNLIFLVPFLGRKIFSVPFWVGFVVMCLTILIFHKKRHVEIRKQHAEHHAHSSGHGAHKDHGDHHQQSHGQHPPGKH